MGSAKRRLCEALKGGRTWGKKEEGETKRHVGDPRANILGERQTVGDPCGERNQEIETSVKHNTSLYQIGTERGGRGKKKGNDYKRGGFGSKTLSKEVGGKRQ